MADKRKEMARNCKNGQRKERKRQTDTKRARERRNEGRGEWKTKFGRRPGREGVDFAGESVSSPLRIPIKTWPPFRNTLRACV